MNEAIVMCLVPAREIIHTKKDNGGALFTSCVSGFKVQTRAKVLRHRPGEIIMMMVMKVAK